MLETLSPTGVIRTEPIALRAEYTLMVTRNFGDEFWEQMHSDEAQGLVREVRQFLLLYPSSPFAGVDAEMVAINTVEGLKVALCSQLGLPEALSSEVFNRILDRKYCLCFRGMSNFTGIEKIKYRLFRKKLRAHNHVVFDDLL